MIFFNVKFKVRIDYDGNTITLSEDSELKERYGSPDGLNVLVGVDISLFLNSLDISAQVY